MDLGQWLLRLEVCLLLALLVLDLGCLLAQGVRDLVALHHKDRPER